MKVGNQWGITLCEPATIIAGIGAATAAVGTAYSISQGNKTPQQQKTTGVNSDAATAQADDELRRRSRQGINANLLSGTAGSGSPGTTSTGQKSLLGG